MLSRFSHVQLFETPSTVSVQDPLSMEISKNTGVGCNALLQGIFLTQEWKPCISSIAGGFFTAEPAGKPNIVYKYFKTLKIGAK